MHVLCSRCRREYAQGTLGRCPVCGGILKAEYADEAVKQLAEVRPGPGIDRYRDVLPVSVPIPSLGEGDTPLLPSRRLGPYLGLKNLYFKNEGRNPTGAFKDRAGALTAALALEAGTAGVLTASSGNAGSAISAYCAAAGLRCLILLERGSPAAKLRQSLATGARVLPVEDLFSQGPQAVADLLMALAARLNYYLAFVWAPVNPYVLEGIKSISYEIAAQLPGAPDALVCPVGGGDLLTAQWRGWLELKQAGVTSRLPRLAAVQSLSAPPLLEAFRSGGDRVDTIPYAHSRISGINVAFSGEHALAAVRESGGTVIGVSDEEVFAMQRRLAAEEGIWVEPVGAAPLAALPLLLDSQQISPKERIVSVLSGAGFKDSHLAEAEARAVEAQEVAPFEAEAIAKQVTRDA